MAGKGGYQAPQRPAAVSGPGASSARTDGGPGNARQPIRVPTGGAYGEAKALTEQQQGAPMAAGGPSGSGGAPSPGGPASAGPEGVFGPTKRPNEPLMTGTGVEQNPFARNPQQALRAMYAKFPHPAIQRLIDYSSYGSTPPR